METLHTTQSPQTSSFENYLITAYQHRPVEDQDVSITWLDAQAESSADQYQIMAYQPESLVTASESLDAPAPYDYESDDSKNWTNVFKTQPAEVTAIVNESLPVSDAEKRLARLKTAAAKIGNLFSPVLETTLEDTAYFSETEAVSETTSPERRTGRIKTTASYIGNLALKPVGWINGRRSELQPGTRSRKGLIAATGLAMTGALVAGPAMDLVDGYIKLQNKSGAVQNKISAKPASQGANMQVPTIEFKGLPDAPVIDMNDVLFQVEKNRLAAAEANTPQVDLNAIAAQKIEENARIKQQEAEAAAKAREAEIAAAEAKKALQSKAAPQTTSASYSSDCEQYRPLIEQYDWPVEQAMKVMKQESDCDPNAISDTDDHGLFQLNGRRIYDPARNVAVAYSLWEDGRVGENNFSAWYAVCTPGNNPQPKFSGIDCQ